MYDYDRTKQAFDLDKTVPEAIRWIERLEDLAKKAKAELKSKKEPGRDTSYFVGHMKGFSQEDWYEHFYR